MDAAKLPAAEVLPEGLSAKCNNQLFNLVKFKTDDEDGDDTGQLVDRVLAVLSDAESSGRRALKLVPEDKDLLFSPEASEVMVTTNKRTVSAQRRNVLGV